MKRAMDLVFASLLIFLLSPAFVLVAIVVRISLGTPILFRQVRPGMNEKLFTLLKFRTMRDSESAEEQPDEARLTPLGKFLRSTSLDELPELFNVLTGDMSLVGPRPLLEEYLPLYSAEHRRRHEVRPGITGWAQIKGRNDLSWTEKFGYDIWYVDNHSVLLDISILLTTVSKVLAREGVTAPGHATTHRFNGYV
ncbi:MAG: sugar transferase [Gemmatimonadaceae bacterium]|nr:sugar transferase [Gemmatimonadaceae bacterium]